METVLNFDQMFQFFSRDGGTGENIISFKMKAQPQINGLVVARLAKDEQRFAAIHLTGRTFEVYTLPEDFVDGKEFVLEKLVDFVANNDGEELQDWDTIHSAYFVS